MSQCNCIDFLLSRRSIRKFEPREVPIEYLLKAIDIARFAPSAKNAQPWEFIVVNDKNLLHQLAKLHAGAKPLEDASCAIVVLAKKDESPISYLVDAANAAMYLWLALHCLGLGAVWIQTLGNVEEIQKLLHIPENIIPVAILAIGWPAEKPVPKPRKSIEEITYLNRYGTRLK